MGTRTTEQIIAEFDRIKEAAQFEPTKRKLKIISKHIDNAYVAGNGMIEITGNGASWQSIIRESLRARGEIVSSLDEVRQRIIIDPAQEHFTAKLEKGVAKAKADPSYSTAAHFTKIIEGESPDKNNRDFYSQVR